MHCISFKTTDSSLYFRRITKIYVHVNFLSNCSVKIVDDKIKSTSLTQTDWCLSRREFIKVSMFSLIFYCGLISSVVSAHFNSDTSHDGDEPDINTTFSTLASTTIPVSKDCVLEMKENKILQIVELFNSNLVILVVIHISFSNGSHEGQLFSDYIS